MSPCLIVSVRLPDLQKSFTIVLLLHVVLVVLYNYIFK